MPSSLRVKSIVALLAVGLASVCHAEVAPAAKPNIIFILADDLGYGDVGVTYQNSREGKPAFATPHLDAMAASGMILRQHYTGAPVCAPARATIMTGMTQGHCPIRDNEFDKPLPAELLTIGSLLKQAGYHTMAVGKWGLGGHKNSNFPAHPMRRGFDEFFGYMLHGTGHVYYHDEEHPLMDGTTDVGAKYENVYDTDLFTARAKQMLVEQHAKSPGQPFFMYLAYTAVHNALNVPEGAYPAGGGVKGGMQWPLTAVPAMRDKWIHPDYANKPWTDAMKRYATMARRLDDGVGDVLQTLKDLHLDQNTLVVFTSDNGPANEGGADPRLFDSWGPFDGFKRDVFEGGVREPTLVRWPGQVPAKRTDDTPTGQWDWLPTFAELAGLPVPAQADGVSLVPLIKGEAFKAEPYLYIEYDFPGSMHQAASKDVVARKHVGRGQQQLVRIGDLVGTRAEIISPSAPLRLYDVMKDPHEDHDLAGEAAHKEVLERMKEILVTARRPDSDAVRPYDNELMPAVKESAGEAGMLSRAVVGGAFAYTPGRAVLEKGTKEKAAGLKLPDAPPAGGFAVEFSGYITVPADGAYTFSAASDAGVHLWLHDAHVLASDAGKPVSGMVKLKAGMHPFRLAYRHGAAGTPELWLKYSGPSMGEQVVPAAAFAAAKE